MLAVFILGGFFILNNARAEDCATSTGWGSIKINEVSTYSSSDWVELYNLLEACVDLNGLKLWDSTTSTAIKTLSGTTTARGYSVFEVSNRLNQSGDSVVLKNNSEDLDRFDYGAGNYPAAGESQVWAREFDGIGMWKLTVSSTPGAMNIITVTTTPEAPTSTLEISTATLWSNLKINEFAPDPAEGNEWVEFFNPATTSLDLVGGYLCDSRGAISTADCKDLSGSVSALGYLKFDWAGYFLNNDGDEVILRNPTEEAVDQIVYGEGNLPVPAKGQVLARKVDGLDSGANDDWAVTTQPTPGEANVIVAPPAVLPPSPGGSGSAMESPATEVKKTTTSTVKTTATAAVKKIKEVGLIWKVKYDPRVRTGATTTLDASGSLDPRGGRAEMSWNLGEGALILGDKIVYTFVSSGLHDIIIYVTTTAGTVDKKQVKIMVYPMEIKNGAGVVIDKILPNTVGADEAEYVAVKNITSSTINISNWKILAGDKIYTLPTSTFILAGDSLVFYHAVTGLTLTNTGGLVELRDENDILIDELVYGKAKEGEVVGESVGSTLVLSDNKKASTSASKKVNDKRYTIKSFGLMSVARARELQKDDVTSVRGVVTALPGTLGSQFFYIADGQAGLQIYQYKKDFPELKIGDEIEARGAISLSGNIKRLRLANKKVVDILSTKNAANPLFVELGELDEAQTGNLIKIKGEVTEIKSNFMYVDDGTAEAVVYFKRGSAIDRKKILEGEKVEVTGILEQAKTGLQLWPRSQGDIVSLGPSEDLLKKQQLAAGVKESDTAEKYLTATAGGLTTLLLGFLVRVRGVLIWGAGKRTLAFLGGFLKRG